jgi:hypothetical protein
MVNICSFARAPIEHLFFARALTEHLFGICELLSGATPGWVEELRKNY